MHTLSTFLRKLWRITCANAWAITNGISLIFFVEAPVYTIALVLTIVSLLVFYVVSYKSLGELQLVTDPHPFSWGTFGARIWKITLANILWTISGMVYLFFCSGTQLIYIALITISGSVLLYIDAYRTILIEESSES